MFPSFLVLGCGLALADELDLLVSAVGSEIDVVFPEYDVGVGLGHIAEVLFGHQGFLDAAVG